VPQLSEFYPRAGLLVGTALHMKPLQRWPLHVHSSFDTWVMRKLRICAAGAEHRRRRRGHTGDQNPAAAP
jgi:hypothetical protein